MARLDIFMKNTALFKQRSEAKRACEEGRVRVAGRPARASREIKKGEIINIETSHHSLEVEVLDIPQYPPPRKERTNYYRIRHYQVHTGHEPLAEEALGFDDDQYITK